MLSHSFAPTKALELPSAVVDVLPDGIRSRYLYSGGEHDLELSGARLTRRHADAVRDGSAEFALLIEEPVVFLCSRFGDAVPWTASPYSWHLTPRELQSIPPLPSSPEERRAFLAITLTDPGGGPARATRNVTLALDFTRALNEAIRDQARLAFSVTSYNRIVTDIRRRCPTAQALAAKASIRCLGSC